MKNLWFIFIGMLIVFILFFISFTDYTFDSFVKKSSPENAQQQVAINLPVENSSSHKIKMTTPKKSHITNETAKQNLQEELSEDEQIYQEEILATYSDEMIRKSKQKIFYLSSKQIIIKAVKDKMSIKAKEKAGIVKAKVSISHTMLTYAQAKRKGLEVNFITHIYASPILTINAISEM